MRRDIRFLKFAYSYGTFLGLFPTYSFETYRVDHPRWCKFRAVTQSAILLILTIYCQIDRSCASISDYKYSSSVRIVETIDEIIGLISIVALILSSCCFHQTNWTKLNNTFQVVDTKMNMRLKTPQQTIWGLISLSICQIVLMVATYVWIEHDEEWQLCTIYLAYDVCFYLGFNVGFYVYNIAKVFHVRYKELNNQLSRSPTTITVLCNIFSLCSTLSDLISVFNTIFGWYLAMIVARSITTLLTSAIFLLSQVNKGTAMDDVNFLSLLLGIPASTGILVVMVIWSLESVKHERAKMITLCYKLQGRFPADSAERTELRLVIQQCELGGFTAADFFEIDRRILLGILGTWTTYIIVMIQFDMSVKF